MAYNIFKMDSLTWIILAIAVLLGFGYYWIYFRPKYQNDPTINPNARSRGNSMLILESGDFQFIESRKNYDDNTVGFIFEDGTENIYDVDDVTPINKAQVIAGRASQIWIETKWIANHGDSELATLTKKLKQDLILINQKSAEWERKYILLESNFNTKVKEVIQQATELKKATPQQQQQYWQKP